ncbi:MAG: FadR family transcriptional regulator [Oscillospiraceae bacterium]|jgi:GntR family transcriptional repressor for pyruvate dehydrogenase complex|nr:FadR family transcriptional regulator [Oscillospiraceae bacterium]
MIQKIKKDNLSTKLIDAIIGLIEDGTWKPGDKLPNEIELAASFGVSRNVMREAMKILDNFGVLDANAGIGTFVAPFADSSIHRMHFFNNLRSNISVEQTMETRLIIEPELVYYACLRITPEELKILSNCVWHANPSKDDFSFHLMMAKFSRNSILFNLLNTLLDQLRTTGYFDFGTYAKDENSTSRMDHENIFAAIEQKDPQRAKAIMYDHLATRISVIRSSYDPSGLLL